MLIDPVTNNFYSIDNKLFDPINMKWISIKEKPNNLIKLSHIDAVKNLQQSNNKLKIPIGIIGTNNPTHEQYIIAEELGKKIAVLGLTIICGGRAGIMEAVCKGASINNGLSIGILPELNLSNANKFVTIPLATGIGFARNMIISAASFCLIAIGGGHGTLTEIGYGLHFGKKILTISRNHLEGTIYCKNIEEIIDNLCKIIFSL